MFRNQSPNTNQSNQASASSASEVYRDPSTYLDYFDDNEADPLVDKLQRKLNAAILYAKHNLWQRHIPACNTMLDNFIELIYRGYDPANKTLVELIRKANIEVIEYCFWYLVLKNPNAAHDVLQFYTKNFIEETQSWSFDSISWLFYLTQMASEKASGTYPADLHALLTRIFNARYKNLNITVANELAVAPPQTEEEKQRAIINRGAYAAVYCYLFQNQLRALKVSRGTRFPQAWDPVSIIVIKGFYRAFMCEILTLSIAKNSVNIVQLLGFSHNLRPQLLLNYANRGDLFSACVQQELTPEQHVRIASQLWEGLNYLFTTNILHRDLKTHNILVTDDQGSLIPQIADFGTGILKEELAKEGSPKCITTYTFAAPEILLLESGSTFRDQYLNRINVNNNRQNIFGYTEKSEIYSFAMAILTYIIKQFPYTCEPYALNGQSLSVMAMNVGVHGRASTSVATVNWNQYSAGFKSLLDRMQDHNPRSRPEPEEITAYFASLNL